MVGVAFGLGPVVGSAILSVASWPWLFAINLPIGIVALVIALRSLPSVEGQKRSFDWSGALLNAGFFILLVSGLDKVGTPNEQLLAAVEIVAGLGLKEAKDLVDGAPKAVKEGIAKDEAAKIKEKLEAAGAKVEVK